MKSIFTMALLLMTAAVFSQAPQPTFEKQEELVLATYFHENGQVAQTGYFLDGKLHGKWKMYDESGKKIAMGQYEQGQRTGKWFFWEADGLNEVDFQDSRIASVMKWNSSEALVINEKQ